MKKFSKKGEMEWWMVMLIWILVGLGIILLIIAGFNSDFRDYLFTFGGLI